MADDLNSSASSSSKDESKPPGLTPSDELNANLANNGVTTKKPEGGEVDVDVSTTTAALAAVALEVQEDNVAAYVEDGKNKLMLRCLHCPSKILTPGLGVYVKQNKKLPRMSQKRDGPEIEVDLISEWFVVDDMYQFENIGVSHSVNNSRYLTCADCEMGPVGWNDLASQKCFIALSRVKQS